MGERSFRRLEILAGVAALAEEGDESLEIVTTPGMPKTEVADLVKARWKHVLKKSAEELIGVEVDSGPFACLAMLIAEADSAVSDGEDSAVCDGVPKDVSGQVLQDAISAIDDGFDEAAPLLR